MRISRRNLSLLVEHLLVEGMSYEEVKKGAPKKILKLYKSYMWKAINEKVDWPDDPPGPVLSVLGYINSVHNINAYEISDIIEDSNLFKTIKTLEEIFSKLTSKIIILGNTIPYDVIGQGENEESREVNRGQILSWLLKRSKEDFANNTAASLYTDFKFITGDRGTQYDVATAQVIKSPITARIFCCIEAMTRSIEEITNNTRRHGSELKYIAFDGTFGLEALLDNYTWPNDIELFFQYRHVFPENKRQLNDFSSYSEIAKFINSMGEKIEAEMERLRNRNDDIINFDATKKGIKFFRGSLFGNDSNELKINPQTQYYTKPDAEGIVVAQILNRAGANRLCRNTPEEKCDWCTGAMTDYNYFKQYSEEGPIFYVEIGGERFQIHFVSKQYMDVSDNYITEPKKEKVLMTLFRELAKEFGDLDKLDKNFISPVAVAISNKYVGSKQLLDKYGYMGPPKN
jgi:hypothetical protein